MGLTNSKEVALRAFICEWLKEPTVYCNNCGQVFIADGMDCCETPQYGTNADYMRALLQQNKLRQKTRLNQYASNEDKTLRLGVSILPKLLQDLEKYCKANGMGKLWNNEQEYIDFLHAFPEFRVCEKV